MAIRLVGPRFISATRIYLTPRSNASPLVSPGPFFYLFHCPARVLGDQWFPVIGRALHFRQGRGVADVAQRDADVPQKPAALRPCNWRGCKSPFETGVV